MDHGNTSNWECDRGKTGIAVFAGLCPGLRTRAIVSIDAICNDRQRHQEGQEDRISVNQRSMSGSAGRETSINSGEILS